MHTLVDSSTASLSFLPQFERFLHKDSSNGTDAESDLLKAIRAALDRTRTEKTSCHNAFYEAKSSVNGDTVVEELAWDSERVTASFGGIIHRQWSFAHEGQPVQWACKGWLELSGMLTSPRNSSHYTSEIHAGSSQHHTGSSQRSIFGPFKRAEQQNTREVEPESRVRATFIFLRSIGKIYLENGLEYTFNLPFIVRRAWPLHPYGVMVQRSLEEAEIQEADLLGDDTLLPTVFSLMNPLSEATVVGVASQITDTGPDNTASISKADESEAKLLPAKEMVVWVTPRTRFDDDDIVVTVHVGDRRLSIWRYAYVKPKDTPFPSSPHSRKSRHSTAPAHGRRSSLGGTERETPPTIHDHPLEATTTNARSRGVPSLSSLPGAAPSLLSSTTMANLAGIPPPTEAPESLLPLPTHARHDSLGRNDLSIGIDRMALSGRIDEPPPPREHTKMKATHWLTCLCSFEISGDDALDYDAIQVSLFDHRFDGKALRTLLAVCLPKSTTLRIFAVSSVPEKSVTVEPVADYPATSACGMRITRENIKDLLYTTPSGGLSILSQGLHDIPLHFDGNRIHIAPRANPDEMDTDSDTKSDRTSIPATIVSSDDGLSLAMLRSHTGVFSVWLDYIPKDLLTVQCLQVLALALPAEEHAALHAAFLRTWEERDLSASESATFECFSTALLDLFELPTPPDPIPRPDADPWSRLSASPSRSRLAEDPVFGRLQIPAALEPRVPPHPSRSPNVYLAPILYALHTLGEDLRLMAHRLSELLQLAKLICRIALVIRPEWVDYWKRLCPDAMLGWVPSGPNNGFVDDRLTVWPPDYSAILFGRISNPDWKLPWYDTHRLSSQFRIAPSFAYGRLEPLGYLRHLTTIYRALADKSVEDGRKRAENAMLLMVKMRIGPEYLSKLQMGVAAPLREVARTCQLAPGHDWPAAAYELVGRNDLSEGIHMRGDAEPMAGYRTVKEFLGSVRRRTIHSVVQEACGSAVAEIGAGSGVELNLGDFTQVRFGQDKRLDEVARMLRSSAVPAVKIFERPELSELDMAKEQQAAVLRVAERTLALPLGRAMFTFSTVPSITREAYMIPKMEYAVQLQPSNLTMLPEPNKIPQESLNWGEFHNGVAAALRISPSASSIDSSWIKFNKPSELTPEHAGFLYGLGLTGHLREMVTWHTFSYLTPKHELTSIGVLLGLSAANVGSGNRHVTKLLAVHTPALLPTPNIDLNVPLVTQAAGLVGIGLLFMGTKHRRMAEVCLKQISRNDLVQPDVSNEHREAYTMAAALAFGMVMLGTGSSPAIPADEALLSELRMLIHGDLSNPLPSRRWKPAFDINLTSPAATIALGMMYMKTNSQEMADMLTIPDTVLSLNRIPPSFLLLRTLARGLIMWDKVAATQDWVSSQLPESISNSMDEHFQDRTPVDEAFELAYYNIVSAACFVLALKYAGTAREEPYMLLVRYYDMFSRLAYTNGPAYDHKIKRHAIRDGLNLISIALNMVMAGTGEINCLRRLRYSYGMYNQMVRYGTHVATHMSLGLLFLGGGRLTLGNSDSAIACMITAFFPRFAQVSFDNKSYLQALRHLWVLAVEPRCLVARDVDTKDIVYLPIKIKVKDGNGLGAAQLISPTLVPDFDRLMSIRVDTPRYWPFYLDLQNVSRHKQTLLRTQTIFVKRRTAFLSYQEDPKGSRSLFVRSGSSTGDAATLDFPRLTDTEPHPASDLTQFISSFANDPIFLAFADHFCREEGYTDAEKLFHSYCHASLLDAILQDKPQTLESHVLLYFYRIMPHPSRYFSLCLQDLRFAAEFYSKVFDRRFSGRSEGNPRAPLIREATLSGALNALDEKLEYMYRNPKFTQVLGKYSRGELPRELVSKEESQYLSWYLLRNSVPVSTLLVVLRELAQHAYGSCLTTPPPQGMTDAEALERGIRAVLHATGMGMTTALGAGWSTRSLEEIAGTWRFSSS